MTQNAAPVGIFFATPTTPLMAVTIIETTGDDLLELSRHGQFWLKLLLNRQPTPCELLVAEVEFGKGYDFDGWRSLRIAVSKMEGIERLIQDIPLTLERIYEEGGRRARALSASHATLEGIIEAANGRFRKRQGGNWPDATDS